MMEQGVRGGVLEVPSAKVLLQEDLAEMAYHLNQNLVSHIWSDRRGQIIGLNSAAWGMLGLRSDVHPEDLKKQNILDYFVDRRGEPEGKRIKLLLKEREAIPRVETYLRVGIRMAVRMSVWQHMGRHTQQSIAVVGALVDVSDLIHLSFHDGLTNVLNYRALQSALRSQVRKASESDTDLGLITIDTDNFKGTNDHFGHQAGDAVLKHLGILLKECAGAEVVARRGGDEFQVFFAGSREQVEDLSLHLLRATRAMSVEYTDQISGQKIMIPVTASIGTAMLSDALKHAPDTSDVSRLVEVLTAFSEAAMRQAKKDRKNCVEHFRPSMLNLTPPSLH